MKLTITMDMDNAAFADADSPFTEAADVLERLVRRFREHSVGPWTLRDSNGNPVGIAERGLGHDPYDRCEECGRGYFASQLSGEGMRCGTCDPHGIADEGTYATKISEAD